MTWRPGESKTNTWAPLVGLVQDGGWSQRRAGDGSLGRPATRTIAWVPVTGHHERRTMRADGVCRGCQGVLEASSSRKECPGLSQARVTHARFIKTASLRGTPNNESPAPASGSGSASWTSPNHTLHAGRAAAQAVAVNPYTPHKLSCLTGKGHPRVPRSTSPNKAAAAAAA